MKKNRMHCSVPVGGLNLDSGGGELGGSEKPVQGSYSQVLTGRMSVGVGAERDRGA